MAMKAFLSYVYITYFTGITLTGSTENTVAGSYAKAVSVNPTTDTAYMCTVQDSEGVLVCLKE